MKLSLLSKNKKASDVIEFTFKSDKVITWIPGQFLQYYTNDNNPDNRGNDRYFTIVSAPFEKNILITTRFDIKHSSSFKDKLKSMNIGDTIEAEGPFGAFTLVAPSFDKHYVLIGGGIGITPFRSILIDLDHNNDLSKMNISLLYSNGNSEFVYKDFFDNLQIKNSNNFTVLYSTDRINQFSIKKIINNIDNTIFYLSGPEGFVKYVKSLLKESLNIGGSNIKSDYFPGYNNIKY